MEKIKLYEGKNKTGCSGFDDVKLGIIALLLMLFVALLPESERTSQNGWVVDNELVLMPCECLPSGFMIGESE